MTVKIEFHTSDYEFSYGHKPRGRGSWGFCLRRDYNGADPDIFWSRSCTYAEAKRAAVAHYKAVHEWLPADRYDVITVYVCT